MDEEERKTRAIENGEPCYIRPLSQFRSYLAWLIMRSFGIECSLEEIRQGYYNHRDKNGNLLSGEKVTLGCDEIGSPDDVLELCREIYKDEDGRQSSVSEKCKVLLTISTILLALAPLLLTKVTFWGIFPYLFVFITIFMLLIYFDVGRYSRPQINDEMAKYPPKEFKFKLAKDYLSCVNYNRNVHDFLVDVYRVAKNSLLLGLVLLISLIFIQSVISSPAASKTPQPETKNICNSKLESL